MNRIVLITGGTKGIGLAVAQAFLAKGDIVIGASRRRQRSPSPPTLWIFPARNPSGNASAGSPGNTAGSIFS